MKNRDIIVGRLYRNSLYPDTRYLGAGEMDKEGLLYHNQRDYYNKRLVIISGETSVGAIVNLDETHEGFSRCFELL